MNRSGITLLAGLSTLCLLPAARAQIANLANAQDPIPSAAVSRPNLPPMQNLLAPLALYPDPLIGLMLAAATAPDDLRAAAAGSPVQDSAVRGLAHYPEVLAWMASRHPWTERVGVAFADQPALVMETIQNLRQRALNAGNLGSNRHIDVLNRDNRIEIVPRSPDFVAIPHYDATAVYYPGNAGATAISWSADLRTGDWLTLAPGWKRNALFTGDWYADSKSHGQWREPIDQGAGKAWHADPAAQIRSAKYHTSDNVVYGRPQAEPTPGNDYGYLLPRNDTGAAAPSASHPSTFPGDQDPAASPAHD